ncbi:MAG: bifunctional [glutamate--ammonia ligase]-adenylyl-L-tyrosine phosphorylase/[glutamate--ammonia-ligase] adenylyltransferase [Verrucomicrobia bacterium]|nr:bifunctional [glutamate--ammonia ligase]-adenylyl-L-tyrosine phosphorylase/[glutamate--ammonia-ligase] adenylyltransferase [Verrucomicrobiota bacterium]
MPNRTWQKALAASADPVRARHYLDLLRRSDAGRTLDSVSAVLARVLAALFCGSQALSEALIGHPEWLEGVADPAGLKFARREEGLRREVNAWLAPAPTAGDTTGALTRVRQFKQRELFRIALRDLARLGPVWEITREISDVADVCLGAVHELCYRQLSARLGSPWHPDVQGRWQPTGFCVLGMGKLGGQELNYSSDVDLLFVYAEEGQVCRTPPRKGSSPPSGLSNHQFFTRLAEALIAEVGRMTADGFLYRIDMRLRPEGAAGPLVRAMGSYENFYAQWGQTWERMMLIKARCVAGDPGLGAEFQETIQPFRYPRFLGDRIVAEIAAMKQRIETEVVRAGEIERNVKLGRGGIREVEFIVQTLQLLNAGRLPFLQNPATLPALEKLAQYQLLPPADAVELSRAYAFLREVEHRLQMENNLQTHTIPVERKDRERLGRLLGLASAAEFDAALAAHTSSVRRIYDQLLGERARPPRVPLPADFAGAEVAWEKTLADHGFRDPSRARQLLAGFVHGPGYGHVSPRTSELARELVEKLLRRRPNAKLNAPAASPKLPVLSDPDRVLARLDSFIAAYGSRSVLYETWVSNPVLFELLLLLFDRSEFLAETAIRTPDLVDDLVLSGRLQRKKTAAEIFSDLRYGDADEDQRLWLRRYHQAEFMRIGLRDILGLVDGEQNLVELSALADACLQYALEVALRKIQIRTIPFVIVGLGKLGGAELTYGSDLDLVFVADPRVKNLARLQPVAAEVLHLLSSPTELGTAFATDARLRPDGEKGLLVNSLDAYERYYRRRARLWEIQALTRTRPVAGNLEVGRRFQALAAALTNFRKPDLPLAAFTPDWKSAIANMRRRIEQERTPRGQEALAIKTGAGGLIDAEFIAQMLCLANGWQEANTLRALEYARDSGALARAEADSLIESYRRLRRIEGILRRWSFEGESMLPDEPAPLYRVAVRCGFADADALLRKVRRDRAAIRQVYARVFGESTPRGSET